MAHGTVLPILLVFTLLAGCEDAENSASKRYEFREDKSGHLIRLDSKTGEAVIAENNSSRQIFPPHDASKPKALTLDELSKVTGNAGCNETAESFGGRFYNGTQLVLRSVTITVKNKKALANDIAWTRQFIVRDLYIRPAEVGEFGVLASGLESSDCTWTVEDAYGSQWPPNVSWWEGLSK